jgi:hypothetical protein
MPQQTSRYAFGAYNVCGPVRLTMLGELPTNHFADLKSDEIVDQTIRELVVVMVRAVNHPEICASTSPRHSYQG